MDIWAEILEDYFKKLYNSNRNHDKSFPDKFKHIIKSDELYMYEFLSYFEDDKQSKRFTNYQTIEDAITAGKQIFNKRGYKVISMDVKGLQNIALKIIEKNQ